MYYCGLDPHAKSSAFCIVTSRGRKIAEGEVPSTRRGFDGMLERSDGEMVRVLLEASTRTRWAAGVLERLGAEIVVVDPRKVRVIAETKHKTDKTDARILADLLRTGALPPPVWQATAATRQLRDQVRLRWGPVKERANLTLRARSMLSSVGINLGKRALVSDATWERVLKRRDVPAHMKTHSHYGHPLVLTKLGFFYLYRNFTAPQFAATTASACEVTRKQEKPRVWNRVGGRDSKKAI